MAAAYEGWADSGAAFHYVSGSPWQLYAAFVCMGLGYATMSVIGLSATIAPWFRSLFALDPDVRVMADAHWVSQAHVSSVWLLYALWPFSRLVHAWSIPVDWFRRSHILFRGRAGRRAVATRSMVR